MLVLGRRKNERIIITPPSGERIVIALTELMGDKARIGIDAPKDWIVNREEVQAEIDARKPAN